MKRKRPIIVKGITIKRYVGCGTIYITINYDEHGPVEVFIQLGKAGGCIAALLSVISKMISLALRNEASLEEVLSYVEGIVCPRDVEGLEGCPKAIAYAIKKYLALKPELKGEEKCLILDHHNGQ